MSLYSHAFEMLPRPERGTFSLGSEATRARIPDFDTVAQLSSFTHRLIHWRLDIPSIFIQVKVGASFVCFLIFLVCLILARRIYERSFWVLRTIKRPAGNIVVPNSILAFSLVEGIFGIVFVAFLWETCKFFENDTTPPTNYMVWLLLPWCALGFGAIWAAWGTYFAKPNALQSSIDGSFGSFLQRIVLRPYLVNVAGLLMPLIMSISVMIPAAISNVYWQRALHMEEDWQERYSNQTVFTQEMVQATQLVWYQTLGATKLAAISFIMWMIHAFWVGSAFLGVSWALIRTIRRELGKQKGASSFSDGRRTTTVNGVRLSSVEDFNGGGDEAGMTETRANHLFSHQEMESNDPCSSFFPPVRPHQIVGNQQSMSDIKSQAKVPTITPGQSTVPVKSQRSYLKNALVHIYIQLCAITPACYAFSALALLIALTLHGKMEQPSSSGGHQFEHYFSICLVAVTWVTCLFGSITLFAIAQRTYEPVLASTILSQSSQSSGPTRQRPGKASRKKRSQPTNTSFFETHTKPRYPNETRGPNLDQVEEAIELPNLESGDVLIERRVVTYEENKPKRLVDDNTSVSEPDDEFFKGGAGRQK